MAVSACPGNKLMFFKNNYDALNFLVKGIPFCYMFVCDAIPLWTINKICFKNALELS
jgi:hypothetical protein